MSSESALYPRPDFQRNVLSWKSLDGTWDFIFDDADEGIAQHWPRGGLPGQTSSQHQKRPIKVPYAFQFPASGIGVHEAHEVIWYERTFTDIRSPGDRAERRLLLRFGAVDYESTLWIDGNFVGSHIGGHVPFEFDISDFLSYSTNAPARSGDQSHRITLRIRDSPTDLAQPRGKQYWKPKSESIWYTPTGGIWQSVWLESVPRMRIGDGSAGTILRSDDLRTGKLHAKVAVKGRRVAVPCAVEIDVNLAGTHIRTERKDLASDKLYAELDVDMRAPDNVPDKAPFNVKESWQDGLAVWTPESPILYDLTIRLFDSIGERVDEIKTTTGMRRISWLDGDGTFRLNGKPYFQALVLDQGYWMETGMTPPSQESLKADIEMAKNMGFNGCRKHQKVEDPVFLHWADRLGFLVWGEIANAYEFDGKYVDRFNQEWLEAVKRDINHPCIVTWTPGNESWGYPSLKDSIEQRNHLRTLYYLTKTLDPSRPINDNCGWEHVATDLTTYHDYADSPALASTCAKMEGGILGPKADHVMFCEPIREGSIVLDPGASHQPGAPVLCTEFGGVNIAPSKDERVDDREWGYTTASDSADLLQRLERLVMAVVEGRHTCGFVYTQLTDIEQETNGLYSYSRKPKVPVEEVRVIMDKASDFYYKKVLPQR